MRCSRLFATIVCVLCSIPAAANAQTSPIARSPAGPITRVLAIGRLVVSPQTEGFKRIMPEEVRETVGLYLKGKIDQWYSVQDGTGVVFIMNAGTVDEASSLLNALPLAKSKFLTFELMPLGPLKPLRILTGP